MSDLNELKKIADFIKTEKDRNPSQVEFYLEQLNKSIDNRIDLQKSNPGVVNPKGIFEPDSEIFRFSTDARGIRDRFFNLNFDILRQLPGRVAPISAIHNLRAMQIREMSRISYSDDELGFRVKLKDKKRTPDKKEEKVIHEIEEFILNSGYTDFEGAEEREDKFLVVNDMFTRDLNSIDQIALSLRKNKKGKLLDFWVLDGSSIKRVLPDVGYEGDKKIKFVQQVEEKVVETFTHDDIIFYYSNHRSDIRTRGYGYSFLEQSIDIITSWLFGMNYNKEFFNTSSQPKGIISFGGNDVKLDRKDLEELQREWVSMFRGIKGMWKTPFLTHDAKWVPIAPSNRDMEYNQYIQMISAWIFAIHGTDPQELGMKFNQTQNVLNDNADKKIAFSHDRGLKFTSSNIAEIYNQIILRVPEWKDFYVSPTGLVLKNQTEKSAVDEKRVQTYITVDELRAENDLKPLPDGKGEVILNAAYIQALQMQQQTQQGQEGQGQGNQEEGNNQENGNEEPTLTINESDLEKSKEEFIEIIL
jgi:hypothetical protein